MELTRNLTLAICLIIGAVLLIMGTSVRHYGFEILAIVVILLGVVLALFWNNIFKTQRRKN